MCDQALFAALCSVRRGLPSEDFISQLNKLTLLQQRLQSVLERLKVVEVSLVGVTS